jgi:hypothetical protein
MTFAALALSALLATATTGPAENVTSGSAVVTGTVDAGATYHFEYGTSASYGVVMPDRVASSAAVRETLTNLTPSTTYHYRVVSGGMLGADRTFTTAPPPRAPSVSSRSAAAVGPNGATLRAGASSTAARRRMASPRPSSRSGPGARRSTWRFRSRACGPARASTPAPCPRARRA